MFHVTSLILLATAAFLVAVKFHLDGYEVWKDWGALALSAATFIASYVITRYLDSFKSYNNVSQILLQNRTNRPVFIQWGKATETAFGFGDYLQLEANHVIGRRVQCRMSRLSSDRPCVRIYQSKNNTDKNVTIILWDPKEYYHTKVYQITEDGITEQRNPTERRWHAGDVAVYQSP
jgi:hypothetical protein